LDDKIGQDSPERIGMDSDGIKQVENEYADDKKKRFVKFPCFGYGDFVAK
jgi:hypothetical protein